MNNPAETANLPSERTLATLIELSPIAAGISMDGLIVTANSALLKLYGYHSVGEISDKSVLNMLAPQSREFVMELVKKRALGLETEDQYEAVGLRKDGTEFPLLASSKRIATLDGPRTLAYFIDLTEQRQNESRVREFFKSNSSVMLLVGSTSGLIRDANAAAITFYGYDISKLIGMNINAIDMLSPQQIAAEKELAAKEERNYILSRHRLASGEERDVEVNFSPVQYDGRPMLFHIVNDVTRRKQAELFAERQLKRNQVLMDTALEGIHVVDENGRLVDANKSFCQMLGYTQEEIRKLRVFDWDPRLTQDEFARRFKLMQVKSQNFTSLHRRKDGGLIDVEINAAGVTFDGKEYVYVTSSDVTERNRLDAEIRKREHYQRALLDNFPFAVWLKDTDSRFLTVNAGFAEIFGMQDADSLVGKNDFDIAPKELADSYRADDREVMSLRMQKSLEEKILTKGELTWFETYKAPVVQETGELLGTVGFARDISQRKLAEQALREAESKLRIAFDTMSEGVALNEIIYDSNREMVDYRIIEVNKAFYETADYRGQEVVGNVATRLYGMTPEIINTFWQAHRHINEVQHTEFLSPLNNRWFFVSTSPIINHRFVTSFTDITERRQAEIALRESERFVRSIADNIPGMLGYWNSERRCAFANSGYLEWFGRTVEQMKGISIQELMGEVVYSLNKPYIDAVLRGENQMFERTLTKPNGEIGHVLAQYIAHIQNNEVVGFFVLVTDITRLKLVEEQLQAAASSVIDREEVIGQLRAHTEEINTTLKMLISHRQDVLNDEKIALSEELEQLVMPFLSRLKQEAREAKQKSLVKIIETNLQQLVSSYGRATTFAQVSRKLTPKEIEVASLIRQGLSSKEIATTLSLSPETVSNHRKSIRNKLGLDSRATNLRSALLSLLE